MPANLFLASSVTKEERKAHTMNEMLNKQDANMELAKLARQAREANDDVAAEQYYQQILQADPNHWEAALYTELYAAYRSKMDAEGTGIRLLRDSLSSVFEKIRALPDRSAAVHEAVEQCCRYADEVMDIALVYVVEHYPGDSFSVADHLMEYLDHITLRLTCATKWFVPLLELMVKIGDEAKIALFEESQLYCSVYEDAYRKVLLLEKEELVNFSKAVEVDQISLHIKGEREIFNACLLVYDRIQKNQHTISRLKERRINEYWEAHPQEKEHLLQEQKELRQKVTDLTSRMLDLCQLIRVLEDQEAKMRFTASDELMALKEKAEALNQQLCSLGFFKMKEKKLLRQQIVQMNLQIQKTKDADYEQFRQEKEELHQQRKKARQELEETREQQDEMNLRLEEIARKLEEPF